MTQREPPQRNDRYLAWVRSLPCVGCGQGGDGCRVEAHHCIADRYSSSKADDYTCLPTCPSCHRELHAGWHDWEAQHGSQWRHVSRTLIRAIREGVLTFNAKAAREVA